MLGRDEGRAGGAGATLLDSMVRRAPVRETIWTRLGPQLGNRQCEGTAMDFDFPLGH